MVSDKAYAKLLFSTNEMLQNLEDKSDAFYRRLLVLDMNQMIPRDEKDIRLKEKIKEEADYAIHMAVTALKNVYERGELIESEHSKGCVQELRRASDSVCAFLDIEYFWGMGYITVILFVIMQNDAFQNDFIDFFRTPFMWYFQFCEWLAHPTYDNGFNQKIAYTCGEAWVIRILAIVAVLLIVVIIMAIIMEIIKIYKKMWDKISQMFLIGSLSGIAVLGDVIREYLPVNLILTFGFINVGIMLLKMYFQKKFEEKSLYADNHYD